jgi:tRNA A22 N-methylase
MYSIAKEQQDEYELLHTTNKSPSTLNNGQSGIVSSKSFIQKKSKTFIASWQRRALS